MSITKSKFQFLLFICSLFFFTSCDKESMHAIDINKELAPITIQTEACFSPTCMTLIVGELDNDGLFNEIDSYKHQIDWYKNGELFRASTNRLDCTYSGEYVVKVTFRELNITKILNYTLSIQTNS